MKRILFPLLVLCTLPVLSQAKDFTVKNFVTENAGKVTFNHDAHLQKLDNNCVACHNALYQIGKKNPLVTMAEMEKGQSCGSCHNKIKAFPLSECTRCHTVRDIPFAIPDFGTVTFSHTVHLGMYGCSDCHNAIFRAGGGNPRHTMMQMEKGLSCGTCHDGKTAFTVKENCIRCHAVKDVRFSTEALFSHKVHLEMFKCADCHAKIFIAGPNSKRFTMQDMEKGKSCGACHNGKEAFSVRGDCAKCHPSTREIAFKAYSARFSHTKHREMYQCSDCHSGIFIGGVNSLRYTMAQMEQGKSCGACHDGKSAFAASGNCDKCHRGVGNVSFTIKDAGSVAFSHDLHLVIYKCDDCHNSRFRAGSARNSRTMAEMEKGLSCGGCHDGKTAFTVAGNCGKCHPVKEVTFTDDAHFSHAKHLEMYRCGDCHSRLFNATGENPRRTMAEMEKGLSCGGCHDGTTAFSVKGACDRCHKSTLEVTFKIQKTGPATFSHKVHAAAFKCTDCHNGIFVPGSRSVRHTMKEMEAGKSCGACHDGKTAFSVKENCATCHPVKDVPFKESGAIFSHSVHLAAYRCDECHDSRFNASPDNRRYSMADMEKGKSCGGCHNGTDAFGVTGSCQKCHKSPRGIRYEVKDRIGNVLFSHKLHLGKGYTCNDCHNGKVVTSATRKEHVTMKEMGEGKLCGACHGFSMAFSVKDDKSCSRCHIPAGVPQ